MSALSQKANVCFTLESGHVRCNGLCLLWVISGHLQCKMACPLYPQKRTLVGAHARRRQRFQYGYRGMIVISTAASEPKRLRSSA